MVVASTKKSINLSQNVSLEGCRHRPLICTSAQEENNEGLVEFNLDSAVKKEAESKVGKRETDKNYANSWVCGKALVEN